MDKDIVNKYSVEEFDEGQLVIFFRHKDKIFGWGSKFDFTKNLPEQFSIISPTLEEAIKC